MSSPFKVEQSEAKGQPFEPRMRLALRLAAAEYHVHLALVLALSEMLPGP